MNKWLVSIFAMLLLCTSAYAAADFTIIESSVFVTGNVSQTLRPMITIKNTGTEFISSILINETLLSAGAGKTFKARQAFVLDLAVNANKTATIEIPIVSDQYAGVYSGEIKVKIITSGLTKSIPITVIVNQKTSIDISQRTAEIVKGTSGSINFTIRNTGNVDQQVTARFDRLNKQNDASQIIFAPFVYTQNLLKGQSFSKLISVEPTMNNPAGIYDGKLFLDTPTKTYNSTFTATISEPSIGIIVTQQPNRAQLIRNLKTSDTVTLKLRNNGNVILNNVRLNLGQLTIGQYSISNVGINPTALANWNVGQELTVTISISATASELSATTGAITYSGKLNVTASNNNPYVLNIYTDVKNPEININLNELGIIASDRNINITDRTFTLINTGDVDLSGVKFTTVGISSQYGFRLTNVPSVISKGETVTIGYTLFVPTSQDAGRKQIGSLKFESNILNKTIPVYLTTSSNLILRSVEIKSESDDYDKVCGEEEYLCDDYDIEPGQKLTFQIELKNTLPKGDTTSDNRMENVFFTVTILGIDDEDEDDLEEESNEIKINAGKVGDETVTFSLPDKLPDRESFTYEITAEASVDDGPDMTLADTITGELTLDREPEDVRIIVASINPNEISCDRDIELEVKIGNYGDDDIDEARIVVYSKELNYLNRVQKDIELSSDPFDDDNDYTATYQITVPDNYKGKTAKFTVWAFHGTSDSDYENYEDYTKELTLNVATCGDYREVTTTTRPTITTTTLPQIVTTTTMQEYDTTEETFTDSPYYIPLLVVVNVFVFGLVLTMIIKALRK